MSAAEQALLQLGDSTAEAVNGVLAGFLGDEVEHGSAVVVADGASPLDNLAVPAVASNVSASASTVRRAWVPSGSRSGFRSATDTPTRSREAASG